MVVMGINKIKLFKILIKYLIECRGNKVRAFPQALNAASVVEGQFGGRGPVTLGVEENDRARIKTRDGHAFVLKG